VKPPGGVRPHVLPQPAKNAHIRKRLPCRIHDPSGNLCLRNTDAKQDGRENRSKTHVHLFRLKSELSRAVIQNSGLSIGTPNSLFIVAKTSAQRVVLAAPVGLVAPPDIGVGNVMVEEMKETIDPASRTPDPASRR